MEKSMNVLCESDTTDNYTKILNLRAAVEFREKYKSC